MWVNFDWWTFNCRGWKIKSNGSVRVSNVDRFFRRLLKFIISDILTHSRHGFGITLLASIKRFFVSDGIWKVIRDTSWFLVQSLHIYDALIASIKCVNDDRGTFSRFHSGLLRTVPAFNRKSIIKIDVNYYAHIYIYLTNLNSSSSIWKSLPIFFTNVSSHLNKKDDKIFSSFFKEPLFTALGSIIFWRILSYIFALLNDTQRHTNPARRNIISTSIIASLRQTPA